MVEGARLESVYTSKGYRGFESLSLRKSRQNACFFLFPPIASPGPVQLVQRISTKHNKSTTYTVFRKPTAPGCPFITNFKKI